MSNARDFLEVQKIKFTAVIDSHVGNGNSLGKSQ